jgi:hypothetical protein
MTCKQVDSFLDHQWQGDQPVQREVAAHLENCEACRSLFRLVRRDKTSWAPGAAVDARIQNVVFGNLQAVHPEPPREFAFDLLQVCSLIMLVGIVIAGIRSPWTMTWWQFLTVGLVLALSSILLAFSLTRQVTPGAAHHVNPRVLVPALAVAFVCAMLLLFPWNASRHFWVRGLLCFSFGISFAALASIPLWIVVRRRAILSPALTGATMGLFAGVLSAAVIHLGCPLAAGPHQAIWHATVPGFSALLGFLLGQFSRHHRAGVLRSTP